MAEQPSQQAAADDEVTASLDGAVRSGAPSPRDSTESPPTEDTDAAVHPSEAPLAKASSAAAAAAAEEEEEGEEEGEEEEEEIDWEAIAADAPCTRTRHAVVRKKEEQRGSALRTRRALGSMSAAAAAASSDRRASGRAGDSAAAKPPAGAIRRVIVVGAGYAGISCARALHDLGYSVHVLEGRNRIGGRVHSLETRADEGASATAFPSASTGGGDGAPAGSAPPPPAPPPSAGKVTVELGAAVLMGDVRGGNPVTRLCVKHGVALHKLDGHCPLHDVAHGGALLPHDADTQAEALFNQLLEMAHEERSAPSADGTGLVGPGGRVEDCVLPGTPIQVHYGAKWCDASIVSLAPNGKAVVHFKGWSARHDETLDVRSSRLRHVPIQNQPLEDVLKRQLARTGRDKSLSPPEMRALHWHLANLEFASAAPLHTVSAQDWDQDDAYEYDGDHFVLPRGGYGGLLSKLADGLDIRLRCTVRGIHYTADKGAMLDTSAGVMKADAVVCTLPLGVLQLPPEDGGVLFNPPLPARKQASLSRLGSGLLNKVALFFPHAFWSHDADFIGRVVPNPKHRGRFFLFFNLHKASGHPVLLALAAGSAAAELEALDDDAVVSQAVDALRSMFGDAAVPPPSRAIVTRWGEDKFSRGSYSYVHVGASGQDYAVLGEPIGDRLYFAGEHTIMEHPATVVGAHLSGLRAARTLHQRSMKPLSGRAREEMAAAEEAKAAHDAKQAKEARAAAAREPRAAPVHARPPPAERAGRRRRAAAAAGGGSGSGGGNGAAPRPPKRKRPSSASHTPHAAKPLTSRATAATQMRYGDAIRRPRRFADGLGVTERAAMRRAATDYDEI